MFLSGVLADIYKTWTQVHGPPMWTQVHGPPMWTQVHGPPRGPGPWTTPPILSGKSSTSYLKFTIHKQGRNVFGIEVPKVIWYWNPQIFHTKYFTLRLPHCRMMDFTAKR